MSEDLKNYCEEHDLKEIILLGHSMGGKTAMQFAVKYPEMVSKLIIADIGPKAYPQHHQDILKALSSLDFSKIKSRSEAEAILSEYIKDTGTRLFLLKNLYRKNKTELALRINLPVLSDKIEEVGKNLPENTVFKGDTLFLGGENSGYIQPMDEILIKKHFPKAEIGTISKAGHWLHAENPDEFYDNVMNFL
jgi:pimeloyl-ACP methyl ester carboxylesterase